jgi:glycine dehydrogenase subunit 2
MKLIFERSNYKASVAAAPAGDCARAEFGGGGARAGAGLSRLRAKEFGDVAIPEKFARKVPPILPELAESEVSRHFTALSRRSFGVGDGFYPLGSCTMKYNPAVDEEAAGIAGFTDIHPLQPERSVQGCLEALRNAELRLCEITGMDAMHFSPAAGAHGELTGLMMIKAYHASRGEGRRDEIIAPDSAHGTNPASAGMLGYKIVNLPSADNGEIDMHRLSDIAGKNTAGLMLTNPNTLGLFERRAADAARIVHGVGGLMYFDGANMNAILGVARPGDMGFDALHLNLHKTFAAPHGGGGPGSGPVGCKAFLAPFLPAGRILEDGGVFSIDPGGECCIGRVKQFHGNFLVIVKSLAYLMALGAGGAACVSENAVLNANYLLKKLESRYEAARQYRRDAPKRMDAADMDGARNEHRRCMHEFVLTLEKLKKQTGVTALDVAKSMIDAGMHPPTMYFPLIVNEALMFEPTETETKETLDETADALIEIYDRAYSDPASVRDAPSSTPVSRPDEAAAARNLDIRHKF